MNVKKSETTKVSDYSFGVKILGLDCSSSTIGWGLVSADLKLLAYGYIKPLDSKHDLLKRLDGVYEEIKAICDEFSPTYIAIEKILLFMKGKSQASTITILAQFNSTVALSAFKNSDAKIMFYPSQTIRKIIKNAYKLSKRIEKEEIPDLIIDKLEPSFSNIINKKGNVAKETYDEADGIAAAWACALELKNGSI